jgi:ATP synthase protein I
MTKQKKINDLDDSLSKLSKKLDNIRAKKDSEDDNNKNKKFTGFAHAFKVVSELFANILVGGSIGWTLDYFVNTKPIFLIIFLIIGFISGIYTSYKSSKKFAKY